MPNDKRMSELTTQELKMLLARRSDTLRATKKDAALLEEEIGSIMTALDSKSLSDIM